MTGLRHLLTLCLLFVGEQAWSDEPAFAPDQARKTIERGLAFLTQDAAKWRKEHDCATCHHGTLTVWALSEAQRSGYAVNGESFAEIVTWTKERLKDIDKPRDTRVGWNMVNSPAVYLAAMAQAVPGQDALSADDLKQIAGHLVRHQETDGSWAWSLAPAKNRPPPFFESDEIVTLLACLALRPHVQSDAQQASEFQQSREKAVAWLHKNEPGDSTQAAVIRLFRDTQERKPLLELRPRIEELFSRQNIDGGWSQLKDLPSDAYATGQTLYFLNLAGSSIVRREIQRAVSFLVASQREDGSWPMTPRAHPGATPTKFTVPITYFGSAWGTLGLMRSVPK